MDECAPVAMVDPTERIHHGHKFVDEYEWLRDSNSTDVIRLLNEENSFAQRRMLHLDPLREALYSELRDRTLETDMSVPTRMGEWWYFVRSVLGKTFGIQCRVPVRSPDEWNPPAVVTITSLPNEEVLLDCNEVAGDSDSFSLGAFSVCPKGDVLAYSIDRTGTGLYKLYFKALDDHVALPDEIVGCERGVTWSPDGRFVFYRTVDKALRPDKVWRHKLGCPQTSDVLVYEEADERFRVSIHASRSAKFIFATSQSKTATEISALDSSNPDGEFRVTFPRKESIQYSVEQISIFGKDHFLVLHNGVKGVPAVNFALAISPTDSPHDLSPLIEHDSDVTLEDIQAFSEYFVVSFRRTGITRILICPYQRDGFGESYELNFGDEIRTTGLLSNPDFHQKRLRVGHTSFISPAKIFDCVVSTGELLLLKEESVGDRFNVTDYEQVREWAEASDGTRVPISIVRRIDTKTGSPAPLLLYGYGAYGTSVDPSFSAARISLLDRGVVFAVAHVRGGGELGQSWHKSAVRMQKQNTFSDFIACAEHLISIGETTSSQMVADGGSAGGLLMGVIVNWAPRLFRGIVASAPFVDPLTTLLNPSLPLTITEWEEWGNPLSDFGAYQYIRSYSPYENVRPNRHPSILAIARVNDNRVLYVEPAKWVAKLRATNLGDSDIILKTEFSGHGGSSGRYDQWQAAIFEIAWILDKCGVGEVD